MPGEEGYHPLPVLPPGPVPERGGHGGGASAPTGTAVPDCGGCGVASAATCPSWSARPPCIVKVFWALTPPLGPQAPLPGHQLAQLLLPRTPGLRSPGMMSTWGLPVQNQRQGHVHPSGGALGLNEDCAASGQGLPVRRRPAHPGDRQDAAEDFLQQNGGFMECVDWYSSYERQDKMIQMILDYDKPCRAAIEKRVPPPPRAVHHPLPERWSGQERAGRLVRRRLRRHGPGDGGADR